MVKQRFLTHFKPWLFAVTKAGGLIVGYQFIDHVRARLQCSPLDVFDIVTAGTIAILALALFCGVWAWGEWCWFKLQAFRNVCSELKRALDKRNTQSAAPANRVAGNMV